MAKPVTGQTTFGSNTSGTTTQLDNNFLLAYNALNDLNTYSNPLTDTGAANAYVVTLGANLTGVLTDGLIIQMKPANTNTGSSTLAYNGGGAANIVNVNGTALSAGQIAAGGYCQLQYSSAATAWILQTSATSVGAVAITVRQSIISAPSDANGASTLLPSANGNLPASANLTLTTANISGNTPLLVDAANGFGSSGAVDLIGSSTVNLTWSNLTANTVNYLAVNVSANGTVTPAFTTVSPVMQFAGTASNGNGNYTFLVRNMQMRSGNGSATAQTYTVFVGEANCNANAVITTVSYQAGAKFQSALTNMPGTSSRTAFSSNLGIDPQFIEAAMYVRFNTTFNGYTAGMVKRVFSSESGSGAGANIEADPITVESANTISVSTNTFGLTVPTQLSGPNTDTQIPSGNGTAQMYVVARRTF